MGANMPRIIWRTFIFIVVIVVTLVLDMLIGVW